MSPSSSAEVPPLFRVTLSYLDVAKEAVYDMLALTKYDWRAAVLLAARRVTVSLDL